MKTFDAVIVGAGLVGSTLALVLGQSGYQVLLIEQYEKRPTPHDSDARTMALSQASQTFLSQCGIWALLEKRATPIQHLCVSVEKQWGSTQIAPPSFNAALGYVVSVFDIEAALTQILSLNKNITNLRPATVVSQESQDDHWEINIACEKEKLTVSAKLLIAADGNGSKLAKSQHLHYEEIEYNDYAICANLNIETKGIAYERFLNKGALALLPWISPYATSIWTCKKSPDYLMSLSDKDYIQACQKAFGSRVGNITSIGKRIAYPITTRYAPYQIGWRFIVMGNAAHQLHPIAAQGLNLSLSDIKGLHLLLKKECPKDLGDVQFLINYQNTRWPEQAKVIKLTDQIAKVMPGNSHVSELRGLGLTLLDTLSPLKNVFTTWGMGLNGVRV